MRRKVGVRRLAEDVDELQVLEQTAVAVSGARLDATARRRFARYLGLIVEWNRVQRLTGFRQRHDIVGGLFADSLLFLPVLPPGRPLRALDIGAGAGIPGLPLALVDSGIDLVMVEAKRKRVSFLRTAIRELELADRVSVVEGRAENVRGEVVDRGGGLFDVVLLRSIGSPSELLPSALPYLRPGGLLIAGGAPTDGSTPTPKEFDRQVREYPGIRQRRTFLVAQNS